MFFDVLLRSICVLMLVYELTEYSLYLTHPFLCFSVLNELHLSTLSCNCPPYRANVHPVKFKFNEKNKICIEYKVTPCVIS